jgi:predicted N-acyltransferase
MNITLEINPKIKDWDELATSATIFHTWKYLKIVEKNTGTKLLPILARNGEELLGIFPVFLKKILWFNFIFSPPPGSVLPYLGPVIRLKHLPSSKQESLYFAFCQKVNFFIEEKFKPIYTFYSFTENVIDTRPWIWRHHQIFPSYNYRISLNNPLETIWQSFKQETRKAIRKTEKAGIVVSEGKREDLVWLWQNLAQRYGAQGRTLPLEQKYLLDLQRNFHDSVKVFIASKKTQRISGIIVLVSCGKAIVWVGHARTDTANLAPNDLLQWETIKWAKSQGLKELELIGANEPRLIGFKSKYNPNLILHFETKRYTFLGRLAEVIYLLSKQGGQK